MIRLFTFYTIGTPYEQEARLTVSAFANFGLEVTPVGYLSENDWMKNALARSRHLSGLAGCYGSDPIGMIDADNRPIKDPVLIRDFDSDFACEDRGPKKAANVRFSAGVLLFGASSAGRALLRDWHARCDRDTDPQIVLREQKYLYDELQPRLADPNFRFVNLGSAYNRKPEDVRPNDDTVMIHDVASRRYLKQIGGKR